MSWNPHMEVQYPNNSMPYNSIGSFVDFFGGLTYDHVNYIFADANYSQENAYAYPATNTSLYKFAVSEPGSFLYYECGNDNVVDNHIPGDDEYNEHLENPPSVVVDGQATISNVHQEGNSGSTSHAHSVECPPIQDAHDSEVVWQDNIDPDNMTYEELLELGEAVGTQNRGLSQDQIKLIPTSKFKWSSFFKKKSKGERYSTVEVSFSFAAYYFG